MSSLKPASPPRSLLRPTDLGTFARSKTLAEFTGAFDQTCFLLLKVHANESELEVGLAALRSTMRAQSAPAQSLAFHTQLEDIRPAVSDFESGDPGIAGLRRRLEQDPHFAVTLEKRIETATYMERISVGRARNQDIVLRDASVSKFHAWFQREPSGQWLVADAGSKNGTRINQDETSRRELVPVRPGDMVRFGSVESIVCSADMFWKLAQWA